MALCLCVCVLHPGLASSSAVAFCKRKPHAIVLSLAHSHHGMAFVCITPVNIFRTCVSPFVCGSLLPLMRYLFAYTPRYPTKRGPFGPSVLIRVPSAPLERPPAALPFSPSGRAHSSQPAVSFASRVNVFRDSVHVERLFFFKYISIYIIYTPYMIYWSPKRTCWQNVSRVYFTVDLVKCYVCRPLHGSG